VSAKKPARKPKPKPTVPEAIAAIEAAFATPVETPPPEGEPSAETVRAVEAMVFAAGEAVTLAALAERLPVGANVAGALAALAAQYEGRGVRLVEVAGGWRFETAPDLSPLFETTREAPKRLPKAALETLAVIAYHQPVTRPDIEDIRGVSLSRGTLDLLLEIGFVRPRGRRRSPGRPLTYGTTPAFLSHFGLASLDALPGKDDLKAAGLIDARLPPDFETPRPSDALAPDEEPLEGSTQPDAAGAAFYVDHMADPAE
jgi:segregation and condensation protein B